MMENKEIVRLKWETNLEYTYRIETGELVFSLGKILKNIENVSKTRGSSVTKEEKEKTNLIVKEEKENIKKQLNKLNRIIIPERYLAVQDYLLNCIKSYIKAFEFIEIGFVKDDPVIIYKGGRYIKEGNAWMELAKIKIWESIENAVNIMNGKK